MAFRNESMCVHLSRALSGRVLTTIGMFVLISLPFHNLSATEIVKWTDENGKIHFSDRAPIGKKATTEKIKIQHAPVNSPEKNVLKKQTDYWYRQKLAKQKQQDKINAQKQAAQTANNPSDSNPLSPEDKRRFCRDTFSHNVKMRTTCFNDIQAP